MVGGIRVGGVITRERGAFEEMLDSVVGGVAFCADVVSSLVRDSAIRVKATAESRSELGED